jgi:hypothetical protein
MVSLSYPSRYQRYNAFTFSNAKVKARFKSSKHKGFLSRRILQFTFLNIAIKNFQNFSTVSM